MDAKELRIGNIVKTKNGNLKYWEVQGEDLSYIDEVPMNYEPIPLTEKWLLKFGFDKQEHEAGVFYALSEIYFDDRFKLAIQQDSGYDWVYVGLELKYVHSLQNIFFALTGEELTLKS